jgi:glycine/D-amino acid oxidase-like deaminating enzyme
VRYFSPVLPDGVFFPARASTNVKTLFNLWHDTAGPALALAPPDGDASADVVIIGGGFTGCSAALHLAEAGASVVLLEAEEIGFGASGRNVGLVNAGLWLPPDSIESDLGSEAGGRLNAVLAAGPDLVFQLIERHAIACEAMRVGTLHCAHSAGGLANLRERLLQYQARGWPVRLLSAEETRAKIGNGQFPGALHDARAGTIQPLAYARGLARTAIVAGARLHENSPALRVDYEGDAWHVVTSAGRVTANALLLATGAYHIAAAGTPAPRYTPVHYFQFATTPLSQALRKKILPEGQGCWDTATVMSSFRLDGAGRLLLGAVGSLESAGRALHRGWARRKLAALFPESAGQPFAGAWHGRIAMTADHIPKILRVGPRAIGIHGYSGRGIAPGTVFGKAAAAFLAGDDESALPLPLLDGYSEKLTCAKAVYYEAGAAAFHFIDSR